MVGKSNYQGSKFFENTLFLTAMIAFKNKQSKMINT